MWKVKFNICNVHYAPITVADEGKVSFGTPVAMPGAVSISMDPTGEPESFYADGIEYYVINNNQGYDGDLELAMIPETFRTDILKEEADSNNVLVENANSETGSFALLFEFDGDIRKVDFTELAEYFSCDYGFKLSKIYGFANPINLRMGYGLSIHNMAREINKYVLDNKVTKIPDEKMQEIFDSFYLPFIGKAEKVNKILAEKAAECIKKYTLENASKFKEVEYVEKYIEVPLGDDVLVSGRIDLIRKKDIGGKWHVIIVDYKTGHKVSLELEQRLQLEIYALGYKQLKGENADSMEIVDIEGNNVISSRAVVEENLLKTTEMIEDACDAVLEGKIKSKSCSKEKCKNCSRMAMCYDE